MNKKTALLLLLKVCLPSWLYAQAIYSGGTGSGHNNSCMNQAANSALDIYSGGNGGGFMSTCYSQLPNNSLDIYSGGNDDGHASSCFTQTDNNALSIYGGGNDDGFASSCFTQIDNLSFAIYGGGSDDGLAYDCFTQLDNLSLSIYSGGSNDGLALDCYTQSDFLVPISLLEFNAEKNEDHVVTKWKTASEINNHFFTVEKTLDGTSFSNVANLEGAGTTNILHSYSAIDYSPYPGTSYYRLKQTDFDGKQTYSSLVKIDFDPNNLQTFNVFPNPTSDDNINVSFNGFKDQEVLVILYDVWGSVTYSKVYILEDNGICVSTFDPNKRLASGIYVIKATSNQKIISKKLIIN